MLTKAEYRSILYPLQDSARADRDVQANIQRGMSALDNVLKTRSTVHRAMYRENLEYSTRKNDGGAPVEGGVNHTAYAFSVYNTSSPKGCAIFGRR